MPRAYTGRTFGFPLHRHAAFVASYVLYKTVLFVRDVREPRLRLFTYEVVYSVCRALGRPPATLRRLHLDRVRTVFGEFAVRAGSTDAACVSPAFERLDINSLLGRLRAYLHDGRRVLFCDIGADVGTYSITVATMLRTDGDIRAVAFEPSRSSYDLLGRNVKTNSVDDVVSVRQVALGDGSTESALLRFDPEEPGGSGLSRSGRDDVGVELVRMSTVDAELAAEESLDVLVMKIDVEGGERAVLNGAHGALARASEVLLLVEDFVDTSIVEELQRSGWSFDAKLTPYNSFWTRRA